MYNLIMIFNIIKAFKYFVKGFFSSAYFLLNLCVYMLITTGIFMIFSNQVNLGRLYIAFGICLFLFIIYYSWRLENINKQSAFLFSAVNDASFAVVIFNQNNNIIFYNDIYQILCENKALDNFDNMLQNFKEYSILYNTLKIGIKTLETEDSFSQDINFGDKIWRINFSSRFSRFGKTKNLFILDITPHIKINLIDQAIIGVLNYIDEGVIITNRSGNVLFYNAAAANILKISLVGKNVQTLQGWNNIQPNIVNNIKFNNSEINIYVNYYGDDYVLHRIKEVSNQLDDVFINAPFGIVVIDENLNIISINKFWNKFFKQKFELAKCVSENYQPVFLEYIKHFIKTKNVTPASFNLVNSNGPLVTIYLQYAKSGLINLFFVEDINSRDLKIQFLHEQRLYSLGEIVGSIAHDFNNIITTVLSSCDVILERNAFLPTNSDYVDIMRVKNSGSKAAELIKQIMNISRKQTIKEEVLSVNDIVSEFSATIGRVLGENFELKITKKKNNINIFMNEVSFEQVLINVVLNARDAMPYGGILQIITDVVDIDKNVFENGHYVIKGSYLELSICDSGIGISNENIKKIFEPFFTTKNDKGNGFGLSTVNSIVKQKCGFIKVSSKLGVGSTFMIYLPINTAPNQVEKKVIFNTVESKMKILFVEDEINILIPTVKNLRLKGFNIVGAANGKEALEKIRNNTEVDLLITDISIPHINGVDLYLEIKKKIPNLKVIFTSGKSYDEIPHMENENIRFLQKPYSIKDLMNEIGNLES